MSKSPRIARNPYLMRHAISDEARNQSKSLGIRTKTGEGNSEGRSRRWARGLQTRHRSQSPTTRSSAGAIWSPKTWQTCHIRAVEADGGRFQIKPSVDHTMVHAGSSSVVISGHQWSSGPYIHGHRMASIWCNLGAINQRTRLW